MTTTGIDFVGIQSRDVEALAAFYEDRLGLRRVPAGPPGAVVFDTKPIPFAIRPPLPGVDLAAASPGPGVGIALWFAASDPEELCARLEAAGVPIVARPAPGPFGIHFAFRDPEGYAITVHAEQP